jgi:acetyl esterase/lipase
VWGHSAGAHLASLMGTAPKDTGWDQGDYLNESSKVEAVVDIAGPTDLVTLGEEGWPGYVKSNFVALLGPVPEEDVEAELAAASPITYAAPGNPPFMIIHGDLDGIVPLVQSTEFASALEAVGVPVDLVVVKGGGHALDEPGAQPTTAQIVTMIVDFFSTHLDR